MGGFTAKNQPQQSGKEIPRDGGGSRAVSVKESPRTSKICNGGDNITIFDIDGDGDGFGAEELAMGLGLGEEIAQDEKDLQELVDLQQDLEKDDAVSQSTTASSGERPCRLEREMSRFDRFVKAALRGEVDFDFESFNRADPLKGK
jgi:hypothetical protein